MPVDNGIASLIELLFDHDPSASYLASVDLYLTVLPKGDHIEFLERQLREWLSKDTDPMIVRGLVARRRVRLEARTKFRDYV